MNCPKCGASMSSRLESTHHDPDDARCLRNQLAAMTKDCERYRKAYHTAFEQAMENGNKWRIANGLLDEIGAVTKEYNSIEDGWSIGCADIGLILSRRKGVKRWL